MSGGSYNYIYNRVDEECVGRMYDILLDDMIKDLVKVLHALEWWKSCDTSEETYRKTANEFKKKWFGMTGLDIRQIVEDEFDKKKKELMRDLWWLDE